MAPTLDVAVLLLQQLNTLAFRENHVVSLPSSVGRLGKLQNLDMSRNNLSVLPDQIGCCLALTSLILPHNQLQFLPHSVGNLTQLTRLGLKLVENISKQPHKPSIKHLAPNLVTRVMDGEIVFFNYFCNSRNIIEISSCLFFSSKILRTILNNSDILFGSGCKREN